MSEQLADDTYLTLSQKSESLYKVKGSKHFGYAMPVTSEDDIRNCLELIKKEHHSARHHCYAWRLGLDKKKFRANDDGEPSNSAGKPILGQIEKYDLSDVFICVVRYFGGTKLGVGGLIDAYRTAASMAIEENTIVKKQVTAKIKLSFGYDLMGEVMRTLKDQDLPQFNQDFSETCSLITETGLADVNKTINQFSGIYGVTAKLLK